MEKLHSSMSVQKKKKKGHTTGVYERLSANICMHVWVLMCVHLGRRRRLEPARIPGHTGRGRSQSGCSSGADRDSAHRIHSHLEHSQTFYIYGYNTDYSRLLQLGAYFCSSGHQSDNSSSVLSNYKYHLIIPSKENCALASPARVKMGPKD